MKHNILILGKGFLGSRIKNELGFTISAKSIKTFKDAEVLLDKHNPKIIINAIGHNGASNVDDCELVLDKTLIANTLVPLILAEVCLRRNIKLIQINSGCIFHFDYKNKQRPIKETQYPDYYNLYYSRTKIYTENALRNSCALQNLLILRVRIPLDDRPHPKNLLTKLLKFDHIIDTPNSITYIPDFINALAHLIKIDAKGIYNTVCRGPLLYSKLLNEYKKYDKSLNFKVIPPNKLNLNRTNLILSPKKLENSGFNNKTANQVIKECIKNYIKY